MFERLGSEEMIKKVIMLVCTILLFVTGLNDLIPSVKAEEITHPSHSENNQNEEEHPTSQNQPISTNQENIQSKISKLNVHINQVNQAIQDNQQTLLKAELEMEKVVSEVNGLTSEIKVIEEKMGKRNDILKERAKSFHENGGKISYLELLVDSKSISDFIDRVGAVATIVEADQDLLNQQKIEKKDLESKKDNLETKLTELSSIKTELDGMQLQLSEQQKQYQTLIAQSEESLIASLGNTETTDLTYLDLDIETDKEYIKTIITSGFKYIGNSVYVFGGGRTEYDIANGRFDCSGFVHWAFAQAGMEIGASTDALKGSGTQVPVAEIQPGDLVFFDTYKQDGHVGIYMGNGKFIGSQSDSGVSIADMTTGYWLDTFNGRVIRF